MNGEPYPGQPAPKSAASASCLLPAVGGLFALTTLIGLVIGLAALVLPWSDGAMAPPDSQEQFQARNAGDRRQLFDGSAIYPPSIAIDTGETQELSVRICGQLACGSAAPSQPTPDAASSPMKIGARIKVRASSDMPGEIKPTSSETQPVLAPNDKAEWTWLLAPTRPGEYRLRVSVTALVADTDIALLPDLALSIAVTVSRTAGHTIGMAWRWSIETATGVGGILSALGLSAAAAITVAVRHIRRRRTPASARGRDRARGRSRSRYAAPGTRPRRRRSGQPPG